MSLNRFYYNVSVAIYNVTVKADEKSTVEETPDYSSTARSF